MHGDDEPLTIMVTDDTLSETYELLSHNEDVVCQTRWANLTRALSESAWSYCNATFDSFSCWPPTLGGSTSTLACPQGFAILDSTQNSSRFCDLSGQWALRANYSPCLAEEEEVVPDRMAVRVIYNVGFIVTTVSLVVALAIFLHFRSLRCLRNIIHSHLIATFILRNLVWIIMHNSLLHLWRTDYEWVCKVIVTVYNYLNGTSFYWMFVEGLYLFTIVVWTYSADKIKLWHYIFLGWGIPLLYISVWVGVKITLDNHQCWFTRETSYDFILHVPIFLVLLSNTFFLSAIIWVLITKLKTSHSLEIRQYRKAVRATVILFPLLGVTYVLFIVPPSEGATAETVFKYVNALLQSFQGLFVAVFYCFLNGEVRCVIRKKLSNYQENRSIDTRYTKTSIVGSPARSPSNYDQSMKMTIVSEAEKENGFRQQNDTLLQDEPDNML